jgi:hypothetical protein
MMADETKTIEVLRCQYRSSCRVRGCTANATVILRGLDSIRPPDQAMGNLPGPQRTGYLARGAKRQGSGAPVDRLELRMLRHG